MIKRSAIKRDLRSPKYRPRIIPDKRKQNLRMACRKGGDAKAAELRESV